MGHARTGGGRGGRCGRDRDDGPFPPPNDLRLHRYFFRLYALDVARLDLPERFTAKDVQRAMHAHVLDEVAIYGTYSLNASVKG